MEENQKVFSKYFDAKSYIQEFEGQQEMEFAKALLTSSQLQCFCDDYFNEDEVNNFNIFYKLIEKPLDRDRLKDFQHSPEEVKQEDLLRSHMKQLKYSEDLI